MLLCKGIRLATYLSCVQTGENTVRKWSGEVGRRGEGRGREDRRRGEKGGGEGRGEEKGGEVRGGMGGEGLRGAKRTVA